MKSSAKAVGRRYSTCVKTAKEVLRIESDAIKNLVSGISQAIVKDPRRGIEVHYDGANINIDIYIIIEYGTRIKSVAASVANTIRYHVEKALGLPVNQINVHVRGLRISDLD